MSQPSKSPADRPLPAEQPKLQGGKVLAACCQSSLTFVRKNPVTSSMIAVGLGVGVGIMLAKSINKPIRQPSLPPNSPEACGQRLLETLATTLPDTVSKHLPNP